MTERVVLITGCSSGIGLATAVAFASAGDTVVASMRAPERAGALRAALDAAGTDAEIDALDVLDEQSVTDAVRAVLERHGRIDVLVSNAGVGCDGTVEELTTEDFRASLDVNVLGTVRLVKAVLPSMREAGSGRIIAVSSIAGVLGLPFNDAYCTSKFALEGLFESLHPVVVGFGVFVSLVEPGPVAGDFVEHSQRAPVATAAGPYTRLRTAWRATQSAAFDAAHPAAEVGAQIVAVADSPAPVLRYSTAPTVAKLLGIKLNDVTGERVTGITRRWLG